VVDLWVVVDGLGAVGATQRLAHLASPAQLPDAGRLDGVAPNGEAHGRPTA
jgi:hypothetical protein